jgi:hypothetical protein
MAVHPVQRLIASRGFCQPASGTQPQGYRVGSKLDPPHRQPDWSSGGCLQKTVLPRFLVRNLQILCVQALAFRF